MKTAQILLIVLYFSFLAITPMHAQIEGFDGGMGVAAVVQSIRDSAQGIIAALEASVGNSLFRSRQHLELLVNQVEAVADGSIGKVFEELNRTEQQFFNDVKRQLDELAQLEEALAADVERVTTNLSNAVVNLPLARSYPLVFSYSPLYVSSGGTLNDDNVRVDISGVLLASHEPSLFIDNQRCTRSQRIDTTLTFLCNKNLFLANETVETLTGKLYVYERVGFLRRWFGFNPTEYDYDISITVVPNVLGRATPSVTAQSVDLERQPRSQSFRHKNAHCQGTSNLLFAFNAKADWKIDAASIGASCNSASKSSCNGIRNATERSFGYSCTVANNGSCGPLWKDGRGECAGKVDWEEVRVVEVLNDTTLDGVELSWGREVVISLPEGTVTVRIAVDKVDGTRRIVTRSEVHDPWFDVDVNLEDRHVIIRPARLQDAMR